MTVQEQADQAAEIAARSHGLWRIVNSRIHHCLLRGLTGHRSREYIAREIESYAACAGDKVRNEPVCLDNFRSAAAAVRNGTRLTLL